MSIDLTEAWKNWHDTCLLDRCTEKYRSQLINASQQYFKYALSKLSKEKRCIEQLDVKYEPEEGASQEYILKQRSCYFYLIESELFRGPENERRAKKKRIFEKAGNAGRVTGYLFKSYFRSYVKRKDNISYINPVEENSELDSEFVDSVNSKAVERGPWGAAQSAPDDIAADSAWNEVARKYWAGLSERDRAALYAYNHNCTMSSPKLLEKVNCGKSVFSSLPQKLVPEYYQFAVQGYQAGEENISELFKALGICYEEWEKTSELGKWFVDNMILPEKHGMKVKL